VAIPTHRVTSLTNFVDQVIRVRDEWHAADVEHAKKCNEDEPDPISVWFRGQGNALWPLRPKLYRHAKKKFNENEIRMEFKLRGFQLMSETHVPNYRAPTRLLDWTDGALIALYFAVESQGRYTNSAVWMLDPVWFNDEVLNEVDENNYVQGILLPHWKEADPWFPEPFEEVLHVEYPVAIDPPHVARRVSVQRSRFTVHGKSKRGLESFAIGMPELRLVKFVIPNRVGKQVLDHLSTCGIMETNVFPDLEGLSKELETKWTQLGFASSSKTRKPATVK